MESQVFGDGKSIFGVIFGFQAIGSTLNPLPPKNQIHPKNVLYMKSQGSGVGNRFLWLLLGFVLYMESQVFGCGELIFGVIFGFQAIGSILAPPPSSPKNQIHPKNVLGIYGIIGFRGWGNDFWGYFCISSNKGPRKLNSPKNVLYMESQVSRVGESIFGVIFGFPSIGSLLEPPQK